MPGSSQPSPVLPGAPGLQPKAESYPSLILERLAVGDLLFRWLCTSAALLVIVLSGLLVAVLVWKSWLAIVTIGYRFLTHATWDPVKKEFGALAFVYGTLATSALAMLMAVPLGIGTAAFLSEIAGAKVRRVASFLIEMLAAVPSVVYGFWGMFFLAPVVQQAITALGGPNLGGFGILSSGLILAIMIVPYVTAVSYDVCQAVPRSQREGSLALGASRWQTIWSVVLPYARPGIIGACFLALGRALGETMAVTMLIGNTPEIHLSPFALGDSIASRIANQFSEAPYELFRSVLIELGLLLFLVTIVVNSLARLLIWRVGRVRKKRRVSFWSPAAALHTILSRALFKSPSSLGDPSGLSRQVNTVMTWVLGLCMALTLGPLFLILGYLVYHGVGALNWEFFVNLPAATGEAGGGMANALYGSALLVGLATLFAVPIGLLAAIYLCEYRSWLGSCVRFIGELLGGVPSVVIGIFAYALVIDLPRQLLTLMHLSWSWKAYGWAGAFALGVMMIPIVMRASEESLKLVPSSLRNASYALGANRWQTVLRVTVPAALPAIITGVFLAIARIAGETAPLLLTAGSNRFWPTSPGDYTPSLPVYTYNYSISSYDDLNRQAWAAAFVLLSVVMVLNFGIRFLTGKRVVLASRAD